MKRSFLLLLTIASLLRAESVPPAAPTPAAPALAPAPAPAKPATPPVEVSTTPYVPGRFKPLFQSFRTEIAAISPDGKYLAYSIRESAAVSVVVIEIDHPEHVLSRVQVISDEAATPMLAANQHEKTPGRINWMRWVNPTRIVVETNQSFARAVGTNNDWKNWKGAVLGFDADGKNAKQLANPEDLTEYTEDKGEKNPFAINNRSATTFTDRVWTADQKVPVEGDAPVEQPEDGLTPTPDLLTDTNPGASEPRSLRIFALDPEHPDAVTLIATGSSRAAGSHSIGLYTLNSLTGKLGKLTYDYVLNTEDPLLDRQGLYRLSLHNSLLSSFPFHYTYYGLKGKNRPHPLDEAAGLTGFSVSPDNFFGERAIPIGFDENPDIMYYASNIGRNTYGIYSLNLATKQRGSLTMENPAYDLISAPFESFPSQHSLVFDHYQHKLVGVRYESSLQTTAWFRPEWQAIQSELEKKFPGRSVEINDWDQAGNRFIVSTKSPADPGAYFVFDREKNKLFEFVRRAPWVDANHVHLTLPFAYDTKDGAHISGLVTVPQKPLFKPIPMVVLCPDYPWQRVHSDFQTEVQALADMGFVVVQLNGRGAWGLGLKQRQSLTTGYDLVQVDDIVTTVANLESIFNVNAKRVAVMGRGHGGFIALRAVQAYPDKFRCAVALDAQVNLGDWLAEQKWGDDDILPHLTRAWLGDKTRLAAAPLVSHPEAITKPILMLNYPGLDGEPRRENYIAAKNFAGKVRQHGVEVEFKDLQTDYMNGLPSARAAVFDEIEGFLNTNVYNYKVKLNDLKVIDKDVKAP